MERVRRLRARLTVQVRADGFLAGGSTSHTATACGTCASPFLITIGRRAVQAFSNETTGSSRHMIHATSLKHAFTNDGTPAAPTLLRFRVSPRLKTTLGENSNNVKEI